MRPANTIYKRFVPTTPAGAAQARAASPGPRVPSQACASHSLCLRISATEWNTTAGADVTEMLFSLPNSASSFLQGV